MVKLLTPFFFADSCEHLVADFKCAHDLMVEVCKGSELKGLTYQGGCHEKCIKCKQEGLLICMTFNEGNGKMVVREDGTKSQCSTCKKKVDLYECCKKVRAYLTRYVYDYFSSLVNLVCSHSYQI